MNNFKKHFFNKLILLILFLFIFPAVSNAQALLISTTKSNYEADDSILVTVSVNTGGQPINTIGGEVDFSPLAVQIGDIRYGNSIVSLWVEKPTVNSGAGVIKFTGGIPGGFNGNGTIFTFVAKPRVSGSAVFSLKDVHVLLNNGTGEELAGVKTAPITLMIVPDSAPKKPVIKIDVNTTNSDSSGNVNGTVSATTTTTTTTTVATEEIKPVIPPDVIAPETFVPMVGHHPSINDDYYFVSFFAVDKDSGIAKYEIREIPIPLSFFGDTFATSWIEARSPQVLSYQKWGAAVQIKAYDQAGNFAISSVYKPFSDGMFGVLLSMTLLFIVFVTRRLTLKSLRIHKKR